MKYDSVLTPRHYQGGGMEPIDVIIAKELGFCDGNVVKYVLRAKTKHKTKSGRLEDLRKSLWYLQMEIHLVGGWT